MAKVLTSISLDAPASPVSASVNDTFEFTGTPGVTGSGGPQRFDFKWEVDDGGGFVTIGASGTGLITADTNPIINTNSAAQKSITVTCDEAGSYTIRMAGAPTSGGSYTVLSATQTVEVAGGPVTTQQAVAATAAGAPVIARVVTYSRALPATAVGVPVLARVATYLRALAATAVGGAALVKKMFATLAATAVGTSVLASASVVGQAIAATAVGVASISTALVATVGMAATAIGSAALSAAVTLGQAVAATAIGVASLVTEFIEGVGGGINTSYLFCRAALYRARRRGGR